MKILFFVFYSIIINKKYVDIKRDQRVLILIYSFLSVVTSFIAINLIVIKGLILPNNWIVILVVILIFLLFEQLVKRVIYPKSIRKMYVNSFEQLKKSTIKVYVFVGVLCSVLYVFLAIYSLIILGDYVN